MKFAYGLSAALIGTTAAIVQPQLVAALSPSEVNAIAKQITVRIDGANNGSGVIIDKQGNTYTVLTNWHVVKEAGTYTVQTSDGKSYPVNYNQVKRLPAVDLAMLQFASTQNYRMAQLGDSERLSEGMAVYVAGWAAPDALNPERGYSYAAGLISRRVQKPMYSGYALVYSNVTKPGMSGGPVLSEQGRLVGINGLALVDYRTGAADYVGIPIKTFVNLRTAAASPTPTQTAASTTPLQSNQAWISQKLQSVPVFTITDAKGAPLIASNLKGQNRQSVAGVFIERQDAQAFMEKLKTKNPELAKTVRVQPVSLADVYKLDRVSLKPNSPDFAYIPSQQQVNAALNLLRQSGQKMEKFNGTPLFVAKVEKKGYLTVKQAEQQIIPLFFNKDELQKMLERFKKQKPELASTIEIKVLDLEELLTALQTRKNQDLNQIVLVPPRESVEFVRSLKPSAPAQPTTRQPTIPTASVPANSGSVRSKNEAASDRTRSSPNQGFLRQAPTELIDEVWQIVDRQYVDRTFNQVDWQAVRKEYLNRPYPNKQEAYIAIRDMLKKLNDPFTRFMNPEEFKNLQVDSSNNSVGIGLQMIVDEETNRLRVVAPIEDTPAFAAGILAKDIVLKIDGKSTEGMDLGQAVSLLRGKSGTPVRLTVLQNGQPKEFLIKRAQVEIRPVRYSYQNTPTGDVGYIRLTQFSATAASQMREAIQDLEKKQVTGYILDLRNNPGGLLLSGVEIAQMWLKQGTIVSTVNRQGIRDLEKANNRALTDKPLVVLVNESSASASEILSGALQDNDRAVLVGEKTFGQNSIQSVRSLGDGSGLAVTIARWYTPNGRNINQVGLNPDVVLKLTALQKQALVGDRSKMGTTEDPQYVKALQVLKKIAAQ